MRHVEWQMQPQQWWQADGTGGAGAAAQGTQVETTETTETTGTQPPQDETTVDVFANMFAELAKEETKGAPNAPAGSGNDGKGAGGGDSGKSESDVGAGAPGADDQSGNDEGLPNPEKIAKGEPKPAGQQETKPTPQTETKPAAQETKPTEQPVPDKTWERFREIIESAGTKPADAKDQQAQGYKGPEYSKDEQGLLDAYHKEWPDIAQAELLMRREEQKALTYYIFNQIDQIYGPALRDLIAHTQSSTQSSHLALLHQQVPDYDDVRSKVIDWVGTQPEGLKKAYQTIVENGSPEDVVGLINHWRQSTGQKPPTPQETKPAQQPQPQQQQPRPQPTQRIVHNLKPPVTRRTTPAAGSVDAGDFEGAFDAFSKDERV